MLGIFCFGCSSSNNELLTITSDNQYKEILARTQTMTEGPLKTFQETGAVPESTKGDLIESIKLFRSLTAYSPDKYALFLGEAKVHRALSDDKAAVQALNDAMAHAPTNPVNEPDKLTIAEIYGEMAAISLNANEVDAAEGYVQKAISLSPKNVDYMAVEAGIRLQKKDVSGAKIVIDTGLKSEPNHTKLLLLKRLIEAESTETKVEKK